MSFIQPNMEVITMVVLFGLLQAVLVTLFFAEKRRMSRHRYLLCFLVAIVYVQLHTFLVRSGLMVHALFLLNTDVPVILLMGPLVYLYTRQTLGLKSSRSLLILHLIPFVLYFAYSFYFFLQPADYKYNLLLEMLGSGVPFKDVVRYFPSDPWNIQGWIVVELMTVHLVVYSMVSLRIIRKARAVVLTKNQRHWIQFLNILLLISALVIFLSEGGVVNGYVFFDSPFPHFSADLFSTLAMYGTSIYLLRRSDFLHFKSKKYNKSSLSSDLMQKKIKEIQHVLETEKLYLNRDFSLDMLAEKTGMTRHHISQMLNSELGTTFSQLTNKYRIEEAKRLLLPGGFVKIEPLAYQLGYKSKSSFYNAFKKATGVTPMQWREGAKT